MEDNGALSLRIRQAAFALAERLAWHEISMAAIAEQAGLSLPALMRHAPSKASIVQEFARDIDEAMLHVFEKHPPEGEPHDRLFDVMFKRLEILKPYRAVVGSVLKSRRADAAEMPRLLQSIMDSVGWMIAAARVEHEPAWQSLGRLGLARAYVRALSVWARDDDPGLAPTMAALDRALRDVERFSERVSGVAGMVSRLAGAFFAFARQVFEERRKT
jgi:AcrR family transcriptional regulator